MTTFSRMGLSCLQGPHHSAHRSMTIGTVRESSSTCGERLVRDVHHERRDGTGRRALRRRLAGGRGRTIAQCREIDGAAQSGTGSGIGHLITFASRMSEE